jgi:Zn-finger nucleic acid-binding protein
MDCPRCKTRLTEGTYEKKNAMLCEHCLGVMIKQRDLLSVLERLSTELFANISVNAKIEPFPDLGPVGACPDCATPMENYGYMGTKSAMIDVCPSCHWMWIDPKEFIQMTKTYIHDKKVYANIKPSEYKGLDMVGISALERAFLLGYYWSRPYD